MANNYFDTTGVLTFQDKATATPVIMALFNAFDLDTDHPGDNQAYIARISEGMSCFDWATCAPVLLPAGRLFQRDWFARKRPLVSTGTRPLPVGRPVRPVVASVSGWTAGLRRRVWACLWLDPAISRPSRRGHEYRSWIDRRLSSHRSIGLWRGPRSGSTRCGRDAGGGMT